MHSSRNTARKRPRWFEDGGRANVDRILGEWRTVIEEGRWIERVKDVLVLRALRHEAHWVEVLGGPDAEALIRGLVDEDWRGRAVETTTRIGEVFAHELLRGDTGEPFESDRVRLARARVRHPRRGRRAAVERGGPPLGCRDPCRGVSRRGALRRAPGAVRRPPGKGPPGKVGSSHRLPRNSPLLGMADRIWDAYRRDPNPSHRARRRREPLRALVESVRDDACRHRPTRPLETWATPPRATTADQGSHGTGSGPRLPALPTCPPGRCGGNARMTSPRVRIAGLAARAPASAVLPGRNPCEDVLYGRLETESQGGHPTPRHEATKPYRVPHVDFFSPSQYTRFS